MKEFLLGLPTIVTVWYISSIIGEWIIPILEGGGSALPVWHPLCGIMGMSILMITFIFVYLIFQLSYSIGKLIVDFIDRKTKISL